MNCDDVRKYAYTYLDGEFDGCERGEFEAHLALCGDCRDRIEFDARCREAVRRQLTVEPVDPAVRARLCRGLAAGSERRLVRTLAPPMALAAGLALAVIAWQLRDTTPEPAPLVRATAGLPAAAPSLAAVAAPVAVVALEQRPGTPQPAEVPAAAPESPPEADASQAAPPPPLHPAPAPIQTVEEPEPTEEAAPDEEPPVPPAETDLVLAGAQASGPEGEVLGGGLDAQAMVRKSPFGAWRAPENLRAMVNAHAAPLPPEISGPAARVQAYLAERVRGVGALPIAEGADVRLRGARLTRLAGGPAIIYTYAAYGVAVTAVVHVRLSAPEPLDDPTLESPSPGAPAALGRGMILDRAAGYYLLHLVGEQRVVTVISELGLPALQALVPATRDL